MATLWRSLVCRRVITDADSNTPTYVDGVEGFRVPKIPHPFPPVVVATVWHRESEHDKFGARIRVQGPSKNDLFTFEFPDQELSAEIHRYNVGIGGFPIAETGDYQVLVEKSEGAAWKTLNALPVQVKLAKADVVGDSTASKPAKLAKKGAA